MRDRGYDQQMNYLRRLPFGHIPERLVLAGAAAILGCDLLDPTLDARIYAASEHAIGSAAWLFHLGVGLILVVTILLLLRVRGVAGRRGTVRALSIAVIGIIGLIIFPTDPGWQVVSVPGRLHPTFALIAGGSLLFAGSRLAHPRRLLIDIGLFYGAGFAGWFIGGGAGAAERAALGVVGVLLFLGARRTRSQR